LHVGFLYGMIALLLKRLGPSPWVSLGVVCLLLGFYTMLTGLAPSILRASVMFVLFALGKALGRKTDPITCLAATALAILAVRPFDLFAAGFQMSFGAVLGLILLTPPLKKAFRRLPGKVAEPLVMTFAAQAGAWVPMIACYGWISWISPLTNLVAVPLSGLLFPLTFPVLLIDALCPALAKALAWIPSIVMRLLYWLGDWTGKANLTLRIPAATTPLFIVGFYLTLFLLSNAVKLRGIGRAALGAVLMSAGIASVAWILLPARYVQLDVGQALSGVLLADGRCVVYDTGRDGSELVDTLLYAGEDIDLLFISHAHTDHAGGLGELLDARIRIGRIAVADCDGGKDPDSDVELLLQRAKAQGIPIEAVARGDALDLTPRISAEVLWPPRGYAGGNTNDCSLVIRIAAGFHSLLWTGDISGNAEPLRGVDCDVLQVAHHGSEYATGLAFLRQATPAVALVSAGKNNVYGHPGPALLERLDRVGTTTFRTDEAGAVTVYLDRPELIVRTHCEGSQ
nr:ComEC/Rec2 family competence protein [Clostridia bacterium]